MIKSTFGNYLEEFEVGQIIKHALSKTIFESDNNLFSLLTMNHHPVHLNQEYANAQQHGKILVVGTLVFSVVVGMTVADISGKAIANLNYENIQHNGAVFIGDTLYAETEILSVRESKSKKDRGIVYVETKAYNQHHELVLTYRRNVLIPKRCN
ncbi:MAG: MaoC family dehydratase [Candidatus Cloacimonadales bacterium]